MIRSPNRSGRSAYWVKVKNPKAPAAKAKLGKIDGASTLAPQQAKISVDFCCDAANRARQTFTLSSFLNDENSVSAWPGARGHHEEPLSHCPRRGGARHRQHLAVMNNACKSSQHAWCTPMTSLRHHITLAERQKMWRGRARPPGPHRHLSCGTLIAVYVPEFGFATHRRFADLLCFSHASRFA